MATRTDTFNRADSATTINPPSDGGANWTADPAAATWGVKSNGGYLVTKAGTALNIAAGIDYYLIRLDLGGSSCDVTLVDSRPSGNNFFFSSIWFSYDPVAQQGYFLEFDGSTTWSVRRYNAGATTAIFGSFNASSFPSSWRGSSATLRVTRSDAGLISVYQNGSLVASQTDATYFGTWVGIASDASSADASSELYDSFTATHVDPSMVPNRQPVPPMAVFRAAVM